VLADHIDAVATQAELPAELIRELGAIPSYYLRYFYAEKQQVAGLQAVKPRAREVAEIERELLRMYRDPALTEKPALLERRGGAFYSEAATQLVAALATASGEAQVVDVRNAGALPGLADDDVVELPARIGRHGPEPLPQEPLAPELLGLVQHVAAYERLAAEAAVTRDLDTAARALLAHPLVGQWPLSRELLFRMLEAEVPA
jgi:6-phospho-beta-glucosidase